jgi:broad specificity phosphatase PhoE
LKRKVLYAYFINSFGMADQVSFSGMLGDGFTNKIVPECGFSIFLADQTRKVHFIRHAEGYHNAETLKTGNNHCLLRGDLEQASDHPLYDARLTPTGIQQARHLRKILACRPSGGRSFTSFDLVVVSPLTRTCETALHVFGRPRPPGVPKFLAQADAPPGSPEFHAGIKIAPPRFLVREECRERYGHYVCDGRRTIEEIRSEFPDFDWSEVSSNEDVWYGDERESDEDCCRRAVGFLEWLNSRPESCIAVVTHSSFLRHLFGQFGDSLTVDKKDSLQRTAGNCELRSVVLCSHGNKDGKKIEPMTRPHVAPSTIRVPSSSSLSTMGQD